MPLDSAGARGADTLAGLARDLKRVGEKDLRREFYRGVNSATKPAVPAVKRSFMETLPKAHGANVFITKSTKVRRSVRTTGRSPGIKIFADSPHDIVNLNKGRLRAPTFGRKGPGDWHDQPITPGMFDKPLDDLTPAVRAEVIKAMGRIQGELAGRGHV